MQNSIPDKVQLPEEQSEINMPLAIEPTQIMSTTISSERKASSQVPASWPPPERPRKRQSLLTKISSISVLTLVSLLILSGIILILFSTTTNYQTAVHRYATAQARQTQGVVDTAQAQVQGTANVFSTAQAGIEASATANAAQTAQATAALDNATATATAYEDQLTRWTGGVPRVDDPLNNNNGTGKWDEGSTQPQTGCSFSNGQYHTMEGQLNYIQPCIAEASQFRDFAYQVDVSIKRGISGQAGLLFRIDSSNQSYYFFHFGLDGSFALDLYASDNSQTLLRGMSPSLHTSFGQTNVIAVIADHSNISLFANSHYLTTLSDNSLMEGKIGVGVIDNSTPVDAEFSNAQVWLPPSAATPTATGTPEARPTSMATGTPGARPTGISSTPTVRATP